MPAKDFRVFDSDSHVVEPPALWDKYLDPEYRALGKHALWRQEGRTGAYLKVNGEIFRDRDNPNLPRHTLWRPGMDWDAIGALDPDVRHPANPGASDPHSRLADMDAMGVDQTLLYPTWFAEGFFSGARPGCGLCAGARSVDPRRLHPADICRGPLSEPSLLRP